jgi:hypothetical protein
VRYPTRGDYDVSIEYAPKFLRVKDSELLGGQAEMVDMPTGRRPNGWPGGWATVYRFRTRSGKPRGLRCFTREIEASMQQRYEHMGPYFSQNAREITAEFTYHSRGIFVSHKDEAGQPAKGVYPLIEMEWIEGKTLIRRVDELCARNDRASLKALLDAWVSLVTRMSQAKIGHDDLAGENVMVRNDGRLAIVDYDGVFIPPLRHMNAITAGHPDYQHPRVEDRAFDERIGDFSILAIYTGVLALSLAPGLWQRYSRFEKGELKSENILFQHRDFASPHTSSLFRDLEQLPDQRLQVAVRTLKQACLAPVNRMPDIWTVIDRDYEAKQALVAFEAALRTNDDERIVSSWKPALEQFAPAQRHRPRLEQARQRKAALERVRAALETNDDYEIKTAYDRDRQIIDNHPALTSGERLRLTLCQQRITALVAFRQALATKDPERIVEVYKANIWQLDDYDKITPAERQKLQRAQRSVALRRALEVDDDERILQGYDPSLDPQLTAIQLARVQQAQQRVPIIRRFREALVGNDDFEIKAAYDRDRGVIDSYPGLTDAERQRLQRAVASIKALVAFRRALKSDDDLLVVNAYDTILDGCPKVTSEERTRLQRARRAVEVAQPVHWALVKNDDLDIVDAYEKAGRPSSGFTDEQKDRIGAAQQRIEALRWLRQAISSNDDDRIVDSYDPVLDGYPRVTEIERLRLARARERAPVRKAFREALQREDDEAIAQSFHQLLALGFNNFTQDEWTRAQQARSSNTTNQRTG